MPPRAPPLQVLGDGAACCELVACVVRRHGRRLPIARFLQFDQPKRRLLRATERSRPGASAKPPNGRPAPLYARPPLGSGVSGAGRRRAVSAPPDLRCRLVVAFARLVHLVGALARPLAAGTSTVPGGAELVGHLRP